MKKNAIAALLLAAAVIGILKLLHTVFWWGLAGLAIVAIAGTVWIAKKLG